MPTKQQVRKYLTRSKNGWVFMRNTDHEYYEKELSNGMKLYVKLSHGDGEIPYRVWRKMLKQMGITQEEFNAGIS